MFVASFKIRDPVVPEKSLTKKSIQTHKHTHTLLRKRQKLYTPLDASYTVGMIRDFKCMSEIVHGKDRVWVLSSVQSCPWRRKFLHSIWATTAQKCIPPGKKKEKEMGHVKENMPSNMHKMRIFRSSCAYSDHPSLCSIFIHSLVSDDSVSGQWRSWSDCANAQADLGLHCLHMPKDRFSHDTAQISHDLWTSQKHTYIILAPLNPTFM